jgi:predicted CoA-substrate-specific enzyme activase
MITAGIDVGSTTTKAVFLNEDTILGRIVIPSGSLPARSARDVFEKCSSESGIKQNQIDGIATTGYGRRLADFGDMVITEIMACGCGIALTQPSSGKIRTIIDVGGQDTKLIALKEDGDVEDFAMNDKCAAGTGRFLEMLARKLDCTYETFIEAALNSKQMIHMNSTCAVFAESEVVSLLARGVDKNDIAAAAHTAISERIGAVARRMDAREIICFAGGGACNQALIKAIEENLNKKLFIPESPQTIVALGAAVAIRDKLRAKQRG